jgi:glycosyltransferase involved in cell wall biosynthesis
MIGPYPESPDRINGGVAAATVYLSQALARDPAIDLVGVRITNSEGGGDNCAFSWPIEDLPLGRLAVSTFFRRQKRRFAEIVARVNPDIVHAQGADIAGYLAVECGRRTVVTVHGLLGECARFRTGLVARLREQVQAYLTEKRTIRGARDLIAISQFVANYYGRAITGRIHEIPNAVAPHFFQIQRTPEKGRLLFAGRIARGKGLHDLVRAAANVRHAVRRIVLAGWAPDKSYETKLRNEIRDLGMADHVEFTGLLDEQSLLREFARAEALVLPSYQETAPMVVQQAMAAGVAVIATKVGGIPYQLQHDVSGLLFEPGEIAQLGALLVRIREEESLAQRLGSAGQLVARERYQAESVAKATASVYSAMLTSRPSP